MPNGYEVATRIAPVRELPMFVPPELSEEELAQLKTRLKEELREYEDILTPEAIRSGALQKTSSAIARAETLQPEAKKQFLKTLYPRLQQSYLDDVESQLEDYKTSVTMPSYLYDTVKGRIKEEREKVAAGGRGPELLKTVWKFARVPVKQAEELAREAGPKLEKIAEELKMPVVSPALKVLGKITPISGEIGAMEIDPFWIGISAATGQIFPVIASAFLIGKMKVVKTLLPKNYLKLIKRHRISVEVGNKVLKESPWLRSPEIYASKYEKKLGNIVKQRYRGYYAARKKEISELGKQKDAKLRELWAEYSEAEATGQIYGKDKFIYAAQAERLREVFGKPIREIEKQIADFTKREINVLVRREYPMAVYNKAKQTVGVLSKRQYQAVEGWRPVSMEARLKLPYETNRMRAIQMIERGGRSELITFRSFATFLKKRGKLTDVSSAREMYVQNLKATGVRRDTLKKILAADKAYIEGAPELFAVRIPKASTKLAKFLQAVTGKVKIPKYAEAYKEMEISWRYPVTTVLEPITKERIWVKKTPEAAMTALTTHRPELKNYALYRTFLQKKIGKELPHATIINQYRRELTNSGIRPDFIRAIFSKDPVIVQFLRGVEIAKLKKVPLAGVEISKRTAQAIERDVLLGKRPTYNLIKLMEKMEQAEPLLTIQQEPFKRFVAPGMFGLRRVMANLITRPIEKIFNWLTVKAGGAEGKLSFAKSLVSVLRAQGIKPMEYFQYFKQKVRIAEETANWMNQRLESMYKGISKEEAERIGRAFMLDEIFLTTKPEWHPYVKYFMIESGRMSLDIARSQQAWLKQGVKNVYDIDVIIKNLGTYVKGVYRKTIKELPGFIELPKPFGAPGVKLPRGPAMSKRTLIQWAKLRAFIEQVSLPVKEQIMEYGLQAAEKWGRIVDFRVIAEKTLIALSSLRMRINFIDVVASNPALFSKTARPGFVQVSEYVLRQRKLQAEVIAKDIGPLYNGHLHKNIIEDVVSSAIPTGPRSANIMKNFWLRLYGGFWKVGRVSWNAGALSRNIFSALVVQTDLAGYPLWYHPKEVARLFRSFYNKDAEYGAIMRAGGVSGAYTSEVSAKLVQKYLGLGETLPEKIEKGWRAPAEFMAATDNFGRYYLIKMAMKDGATLQQAIEFANRWQVDYRFVSPVLKIVREIPAGLPFITYQVSMVPKILETLAESPLKLLKYQMMLETMNLITRFRAQITKEQEEAMKPKYLKGKLTLFLGFVEDLERNKMPKWLNLSWSFPFDTVRNMFIDTDSFLLSLEQGEGVTGVFRNIMKGEDPITGEIYRKVNDVTVDPSWKLKSGLYALKILGPHIIRDLELLHNVLSGKIKGNISKYKTTIGEWVSKMSGFPPVKVGIDVLQAEGIGLIEKIEAENTKRLNAAIEALIAYEGEGNTYYAQKTKEEIIRLEEEGDKIPAMYAALDKMGYTELENWLQEPIMKVYTPKIKSTARESLWKMVTIDPEKSKWLQPEKAAEQWILRQMQELRSKIEKPETIKNSFLKWLATKYGKHYLRMIYPEQELWEKKMEKYQKEKK